MNVDVISCRHFYVEFWMSFIFALNELPSGVVVQLNVFLFPILCILKRYLVPVFRERFMSSIRSSKQM